jgi:hypothetical protein
MACNIAPIIGARIVESSVSSYCAKLEFTCPDGNRLMFGSPL